MNQDLPDVFTQLYAKKAMPEVDPADLRAVYNFSVQRAKDREGNMGVGQSVYEKLCSPGADTLVVWYRSAMLALTVSMLTQTVPESLLQAMPPDEAKPFPNISEAVRQDLSQSSPPDYVFEVMARFPTTGMAPGKMEGMPMDVPGLIAEWEQARLT